MTWLTAGGIAAACAVATILGKGAMKIIEGAKEWVRMTLQIELAALRAGIREELNGRYPRKEYTDRQFGSIEKHLAKQDAHLEDLQSTVAMIAKNCPTCE